MNAIVFTGPTLSPQEAGRELDALYLGPAAQGDVLRALQKRPRAIGIIDGYFERIPSVWHKEILWAMSQGVHVFGSASMGALRAAELAAFGMEGVGRIYEAFRDGVLEDDDEVAVAHGPAELRFAGQSDAMVNIRATLEAAAIEAVISPALHENLLQIAKNLFYPDRSYARVLEIAEIHGVPHVELAPLKAWLPQGRVDQKRLDALVMLREMKRRLEMGLPRKAVTFHFERTLYWERTRLEAETSGNRETEPLEYQALLEEMQLNGSYPRLRQAALARVLAIEAARRLGMEPSSADLQETAHELRRDLGLLSPQAAERWLRENDLEGEELDAFLEEEALARWAQRPASYRVSAQLPNQLRAAGRYAALARRTRHKQQVLADRDLVGPTLEDTGMSQGELFHWFFEVHLHQPFPADLSGYARRSGFQDLAAFRRAAVRECCYVMWAGEDVLPLEM